MKSFARLSFLLAVLWLNGAAAAAQKADAQPAKPNFLIILADDMGFSDLGCYGSEIATPNLDALAKEGLRFTQFYNTARCWPSRAALMTGYYAQAVRRDTVPGVQSGSKGTRPDWARLMTEFLREAGYRTYHSGKWHIDGLPLENGFDHSYQVSYGENNHFMTKGTTEDGSPVPQTTNYYSATAFAEHAVKCLKDHAQHYKGQPFFSYLAFTTPHFPLQAPAADIAKYKDSYLKGWNAIAAERHARLTKLGITSNALPKMEVNVGPPYDHPEVLKKLGPGEVNRPLPWSELTPEQRRFQAGKMAIHAAMVDRMDQEIGRVILQLKEMGAYDNTLILFASDNGASAEIMVRGEGHDPNAPMGSGATFLCLGPGWSSASNTPFRRHKTWVHEGGISTPLIAHWPAGIQGKGELRRVPSHIVDIMPTVLELAGAKSPLRIGNAERPPAPGRSLVRAFTQDLPSIHDTIWWEHENNCALQTGSWKLVKDKKNPWELYDLSRDRGESHNLAAANPEKLKELSRLWEKQTAEIHALALKDAPLETPVKKKKKRAQQ